METSPSFLMPQVGPSGTRRRATVASPKEPDASGRRHWGRLIALLASSAGCRLPAASYVFRGPTHVGVMVLAAQGRRASDVASLLAGYFRLQRLDPPAPPDADLLVILGINDGPASVTTRCDLLSLRPITGMSSGAAIRHGSTNLSSAVLVDRKLVAGLGGFVSVRLAGRGDDRAWAMAFGLARIIESLR